MLPPGWQTERTMAATFAITSEPTADEARRRIGNRLRHLLGLRQTFRIAGVRYRELTADSLRQAMSRSGRGHKDYEAVFPGGGSMLLRCTRDRVYADLAGPRLLGIYALTDPMLRPGMRVLIPQGGTGYAGAWAASRVAPSGAVVSLESDRESVEYAQKRYRLPNASFEFGGIEALAGETDGGFDAVIVVEALAQLDNEAAAARELWRLVRPGGWLVAAARRSAAESIAALGPSLVGSEDLVVLRDAREGWGVVRAAKPREETRR